MQENKYHWYLISGSSAMGYHNVEVALHTKDINKKDLDDFKKILCERGSRHFNTDVNVCVMSISYLGYATKTEFYKEEKDNE